MAIEVSLLASKLFLKLSSSKNGVLFIYQALSILAESTQEEPVSDMTLYGLDGKMAWKIDSNQYSDGRKEYVISEQ